MLNPIEPSDSGTTGATACVANAVAAGISVIGRFAVGVIAAGIGSGRSTATVRTTDAIAARAATLTDPPDSGTIGKAASPVAVTGGSSI